MFQARDKKSKSFQVCCPCDMQAACDVYLLKFKNNIFKYGTSDSLFKMTFGI